MNTHQYEDQNPRYLGFYKDGRFALLCWPIIYPRLYMNVTGKISEIQPGGRAWK